MSLSRWQTVSQIFEAALDLPAHEREAFIREACGADAELKSEIMGLLAADDKAGSFLERPALSTLPAQTRPVTSPLLAEGSIVADRFRIIRFIGQGGMGQVYEALDLELNSRIALKAIRPEIAADPLMLSRFRREVQLTRMITHANVCRTFDIERQVSAPEGKTGDLTFLTMELLEGETLSARLRRGGRFTQTEALPLVLQMIDALAAAHAVGVIHRDFKPSNVLLVPSASGKSSASRPGSATPPSNSSSGSESSTRPLRAVVTDFGLARAVANRTLNDGQESGPVASSLTGEQALMGTLVYMAPEQFERGEASVASDVYSLGLVMFEMITGKRPFADDIPFAEAAKRLKQAAPRVWSFAPEIPPAWDATISRCLTLEAKDRFENVQQVARALQDPVAVVAPTPVTGPVRGMESQPKPKWGSRLRRILAATAIVAVSVSLSVFGFRLYKSKADSKVEPGALIYLVPVKNESGEKSFDNVSELMRAGLEQSVLLRLMDQERVGDILQLMKKLPDAAIDQPTAREIAMRAGAVRVIFPTLRGSAGNYELAIDIQEPDTSPSRYRNRWTKDFAWHLTNITNSNETIPNEMLGAIRNAADWIRFIAGESKNDIARLDVPPEEATTSSWVALADYVQARKLEAAGRLEDTAILLDRAVHSDPEFGLAFAMKADVLFALHRQAEGRASYDRALDVAAHNRLTRREQDRIQGMRAMDAGDYEVAIDAFRDLTRDYPNAIEGWLYPTLALRMLKRDEEAVANLRHAIDLAPNNGYAPYGLGQELLILNRTQEVPQWVRYLREHNYPENAADLESIWFSVEHNYADARRALLFLRTSAIPTRRSESYLQLAGLDAEIGNTQVAIDELDEGMSKDKEGGDQQEYAAKLLAKAYLECKLERYEACLLDEHAGFSAQPTVEQALAADAVLDLARTKSISLRGRIRQELQEILKLEGSSDFGRSAQQVKLRTNGELQLADGHPAEGLKTMEAAAINDEPVGNRDYLAHALLAVAETKRDKAEVRALLSQVQTAYAAVALHPALARCEVGNLPLGAYGDQLEAYLKVSRSLGDRSEAVRRAEAELSALRAVQSTATIH